MTIKWKYTCFKLASFFTILGFGSFSFSQQYVIKNYGVTEGLGQSQVQSIAQDSLGYLWVGTMGGGVSRFDGETFKNFTKKKGLASNFVVSLQVINANTILVGTKTGLSKITNDSIYSNFTNSPLDSLIIQEIQLPYISTSGGLFLYENNTVIPFGKRVPKCGKGIFQVATNSRGMWAATNHGIVEVKDSSIKCRTDLNRVHNNYFMGVVSDHNETVWAGSLGGGVTKLLPNGNLEYYSSKAGLKTFDVSCLFVDNKNNLWIGSRGQGVSKYDGKKFTHISTKNGLGNDFVNTIFQDRNGIIWFGTSNGISKYKGDKYVLYEKTSFLNGGGAYTLFEDENNTAWYGTFSGGVIQKKGEQTTARNGRNGFTSKRVKTISQDKEGTIWLGSDGGGVFNYKDGRMRKLPLLSIWVRDIKHDNDQTHYLASLGNGLIVIKGDTVSNYLTQNGLLSNRVNKIILDTVVWLATDKGLCYFKEDSIYQVKELAGIRFTSLAKLSNGLLCLGNIGGGVVLYTPTSIQYLNEGNGLSSDNIYALHTEGNKLWVGTEKGLDELTIDKNGIITKNIKHTINEGFLGVELLRNSIYKDKQDNFWFGTVNGMVHYKPKEELVIDTSSVKLALEGIELFYEPIQESSLFGGSIVLSKTDFSFKQNHFTFRFKGVDLASNKTFLYRWRLIGLDEIWTTATSQKFATYANLAPGKYVFEVQAKGDNNKWSNSSQTSFFIEQPYWKSTWFLTLVVLSGLLLLGIIAWLIIRSINKKNKERNKQLIIDRRMIELEQQALRLQMNPHFLFNSLNAIKGAVANEKTKEAKRSIDQFAKLMRAMLDNTKEGFVSLGKEIDLITHYLELELLNHSFDFNISLDDKVNPDALIPAMMIQPLVENAVLHGISPLKGTGNIDVYLKEEGDVLSCTITDNGIGREASRLAKANSVHKQESMAMHIITSRLKLIKEKHENVGLEIKDNEKGGTIVILRLPIK